jgi:hypothetical protein
MVSKPQNHRGFAGTLSESEELVNEAARAGWRNRSADRRGRHLQTRCVVPNVNQAPSLFEMRQLAHTARKNHPTVPDILANG